MECVMHDFLFRLDMSFTKIELKHWNKIQAHVAENRNGSAPEGQTLATSVSSNANTNHQMDNLNLCKHQYYYLL